MSHPRKPTSRFRVVVIESERGWGRKTDSIEYFDAYDEAEKFERAFNADNPPRSSDGRAPDWYMQAQDPERIA
jgi:hypothetical protein